MLAFGVDAHPALVFQVLDVNIIDIFENCSAIQRYIRINYGMAIEPEVDKLSKKMQAADELPYQFPPRYWALKMLEDDSEAERMLSQCRNYAA